jgi:hypothetical protein
MGDRNNIKITYRTGDSVYLYSHWGGSELGDIVRSALAESARVSDESYFARVLFSRMIRDDIDGETGFGIAPYAPDQDYGNKMIHIDYNTKPGTIPAIDWEHTE